VKTAIKSFRIKREYLTDVPTTSRVVLNMPDGTVTEGVAYGNTDHPKFAELRNKLEELGYIKTERGWWNGDRVLRKFKLNGKVFKKGDRFSCACALAVHFRVKNKSKK